MEAKIHQLEEKIASPSIPHESKEYQQLLNQYDQLQHDFQENNGYGYENEVKAVLHGFQFLKMIMEKWFLTYRVDKNTFSFSQITFRKT